MEKILFKTMRNAAAMGALFCLGGCATMGQGLTLGRDAPEGFSWGAPSPSEMSFRALSMDGKPYTLYMKTGDFFVPVEFSPSRSLAGKYPAPLSSKIEFYERSAEGGKTFFAPVLTVQSDGVRDAVFAVSASGDGKFKSVCVDIGLEKMPLASFSVVNMSPRNMGFTLGRSSFMLKPFGSKTEAFPSGEPEIKSATLRTYDVGNPKAPKLIISKTYSFWTDKRMVVFVFDLPRASDEGFTDNNIPATIMYDRGPR